MSTEPEYWMCVVCASQCPWLCVECEKFWLEKTMHEWSSVCMSTACKCGQFDCACTYHWYLIPKYITIVWLDCMHGVGQPQCERIVRCRPQCERIVRCRPQCERIVRCRPQCERTVCNGIYHAYCKCTDLAIAHHHVNVHCTFPADNSPFVTIRRCWYWKDRTNNKHTQLAIKRWGH
jgi:hypothetical protein